MVFTRDPASFRDPNGHIFNFKNNLYRQINIQYKPAYDQLIKSGLYKELVANNTLIAHKEVHSKHIPKPPTAYKIIQPNRIPFISYPYEWCFEMLKTAALLTLQIQKKALSRNMSLKDATPFNVQFIGIQPIFIDTLSFEIYEMNAPWIAYKQFCQQFLAPLTLMSMRHVELGKLLSVYLEGISLDLIKSLLPLRSYVQFTTLLHIHLHALLEKRAQKTSTQKKMSGTFSKKAMSGLIANLEQFIADLELRKQKSFWNSYYQKNSYSSTDMKKKLQFVKTMVQKIKPKSTLDLGANTGLFSTIASAAGSFVVALDNDHASVDALYKSGSKTILPLWIDITNPSPALGWNHTERRSFAQRASFDLVLALALVHHLVISRSIPLGNIMYFFSTLAPVLIIEFIPTTDVQVREMLARKRYVQHEYSQEYFEKVLGNYFRVTQRETIGNSGRILYLLRRKLRA